MPGGSVNIIEINRRNASVRDSNTFISDSYCCVIDYKFLVVSIIKG